jgi:formylglycine-generating enzyme required for sulfatase activity
MNLSKGYLCVIVLLAVCCGCQAAGGQGDTGAGDTSQEVQADVAVDARGDVSGEVTVDDGQEVDIPDSSAGDSSDPGELIDTDSVLPDAVDADSYDDLPIDDTKGDDAVIDTVIQDAVVLGCAPAGPAAPIVDCDNDIPFAGGVHQTCTVVPAGQCHTFWMGAVPNELYIVPMQFEVPRHVVHLTGFSISKFPVTVADYRACVAAGTCDEIPAGSCLADPLSGNMDSATPNFGDDSKLQHPVNCVSHADAVAFCQWVGGDLPTEARFEYASAGPMTDEDQIIYFPWGSDLSTDGGRIPDYAECHANIMGKTSYADPFPESSPVGFFDGGLKTRAQGGWSGGPDTYQTCDDAGPFGTRDMTHNILELMKDSPSLYQDWAPGMIDPLGPDKCVGVTIRNTSWRYEDIVHARVTERHFICLVEDQLPEGVPFDRNVIRSSDIGFRCAFDL